MENNNTNTGFFSKNNDLRNRILFTVLMLCVYRLGTYIPLPGIDAQSLQSLMQTLMFQYNCSNIYLLKSKCPNSM